VSVASQSSANRPAALFDAKKIIEQLQHNLQVSEQKLQISELRVLVLEREVVELAVGNVRAGARGQPSGSASGERTPSD
jgi:hypothetical protein